MLVGLSTHDNESLEAISISAVATVATAAERRLSGTNRVTTADQIRAATLRVALVSRLHKTCLEDVMSGTFRIFLPDRSEQSDV